MSVIKIGLVQMPVCADKEKNIETARQYLSRASTLGCQLAVLPEMFCCPYDSSSFPKYSERAGGYVHSSLSAMAKELSIYLVGGSIPEQDGDRLYNTSFVFSPSGRQLAFHRKMHLFDIDVAGGQRFMESETLSAGSRVTVFDTPFCKIGLCICYDMRFPELSRLMVDAGAEIIIAPAAFNMTTGPAHWELLFRQRAVDNQCFTLGCAPSRDLSASYVSYGGSIAVSPWGDVLCRLDEKPGLLTASLDLDRVKAVRQQLPLLKGRRLDVYRLQKL